MEKFLFVSLFLMAVNSFAADVCAQSHSGTIRDIGADTTVQICDQFYDQAPLVHPPEADDFSNASQVRFYGAINTISPTNSFLTDRTGQQWIVLNSNGALNPTYDYSAFPATMGMPSNIYLYVVYRFQGKIVPVPSSILSQNPGAKGIILTSASPVIYVPGILMDQYLLGSWEGSINKRINPAPASGFHFFDPQAKANIRITFSTLNPFSEPFASNVLTVWPDESHQGQKLLDVTVSDVVGVVDNFKSGVVGSNGTCLTPLSNLNNANPFLGATSDVVEFYRYPSMHGAGSEAVVMVFPVGTQSLAPTGMSVPFFMKASTLILSHPQFVANEHPHSLPNGFAIEGLHKVSGGGSPCTATP